MMKNMGSKKGKGFGFAMLAMSILLWILSMILRLNAVDVIHYVQRRVFKVIHVCDAAHTPSTVCVAILCAAVTFLAMALLLSSMICILHKKPLHVSIRQAMYRYFAFFGLSTLVIESVSWNIICEHLPTKAPHIFDEVDLILFLLSECDVAILYLAVFSAAILILCFTYDIGDDLHIGFNKICFVIWILYGFNTLHHLIANFRYGIWFLLFDLVCHALLGWAIYVCKHKDEPLYPEHDLIEWLLDAEILEECSLEQETDVLDPQLETHKNDTLKGTNVMKEIKLITKKELFEKIGVEVGQLYFNINENNDFRLCGSVILAEEQQLKGDMYLSVNLCNEEGGILYVSTSYTGIHFDELDYETFTITCANVSRFFDVDKLDHLEIYPCIRK